MDFETLATSVRGKKGLATPDEGHIVLCFDPGHTTGWAVFRGFKLIDCGEIDTTDIPRSVEPITSLFASWQPDVVVIEDYRVYDWRAKHHAGSDLLTTRVIGCIETLCVQHFIRSIVKQPAHMAKKFCTDKKLRYWDFYHKGSKHTNDAIRHGCYFLVFGPIQKKDKARLTVG